VTMILIDHPDEFRTGSRVLMLTARHKDGHEHERKIMRVSHDADQYKRRLEFLMEIARPGERIYASAAARDIAKAMRVFREHQLASEFDSDPTDFYRRLDDRWVSALMSTRSVASKRWIFDADTTEQLEAITNEVATRKFPPGTEPYSYFTKSGGMHIVTHPFDRSKLSATVQKTLHADSMLLVAY
jgi:hypothetical protein